MRVNHRAELGKVTPGHISMVIGEMVCCQAGRAKVVQQASVHASEGGKEKLLALCERAMSVNHRAEHGKMTPSHISMVTARWSAARQAARRWLSKPRSTPARVARRHYWHCVREHCVINASQSSGGTRSSDFRPH